jgi:hypothetical protein
LSIEVKKITVDGVEFLIYEVDRSKGYPSGITFECEHTRFSYTLLERGGKRTLVPTFDPKKRISEVAFRARGKMLNGIFGPEVEFYRKPKKVRYHH